MYSSNFKLNCIYSISIIQGYLIKNLNEEKLIEYYIISIINSYITNIKPECKDGQFGTSIIIFSCFLVDFNDYNMHLVYT